MNNNRMIDEDDCLSCRNHQSNGLDLTPVKDNTTSRCVELLHDQDGQDDQDDDEDERGEQLLEYNYNYDGSLHIDSIHLPSIPSSSAAHVIAGGTGPVVHATSGADSTINGFDQVDSRRQQQQQHMNRSPKRCIRPDDVFLTPIPMPPARHVSSAAGRYNLGANTTNYNSDTDSSLMQGPCCQMPTFKTKR